MSFELSIIISVVSVVFALYSGFANLKRNSRKDDQEHASQITTMIVKLENISTICTEIKSELSSVKTDIKQITERLTVVEQSTKAAHKRLDDFIK